MARFLRLNPELATELGLHEPYDNMLPNGSTFRLFENHELGEEWLRNLKANVNREELNEENKLDWEVLERIQAQSKFELYEHRMHELNPDAFNELGGIVFLMLTRDYAPLEKRVDAIASRLEIAPKYLEQFRSRFDKSKPVKLWTEVAVETAQGIGGLFQFLLQLTKGKVTDKTYQRLSNAVQTLMPEFEKHMIWLNNLLPQTVENWVLGKDKFEQLLKLRDLGMTSDEILRLGEKYFIEMKQEKQRLAQIISPTKTVGEVMKMIETDAPQTFEEALAYTQKTMEEARAFVQNKQIATLDPDDKLLVVETPAFVAPLIPFAALIMPSKYDKPQIGIYVVTRPRDTANLGKNLNHKSIRNTAVHEAYPGHFLQGSASNKYSAIRLLAGGTETVEGWAHYCEQMMVEKGFITDAETKLVQVNDAIWRAVRIIVDVKLSRGEMSFDEAVDMLVKEADMSKEAAVAEVKRYTQTPGYALSYLLGKHMILALKKELQDKTGARFSERAFHDTLISHGYLPISLVRRIFERQLPVN